VWHSDADRCSICGWVCVYFGVCVHALKEKRLELSTPNSVYNVAGSRKWLAFLRRVEIFLLTYLLYILTSTYVDSEDKRSKVKVTRFKFSVCVVCDSGLVLFWLRCDMLCTSGFVNDDMLYDNGPCGAGNASRVLAQSDSPGGSTGHSVMSAIVFMWNGGWSVDQIIVNPTHMRSGRRLRTWISVVTCVCFTCLYSICLNYLTCPTWPAAATRSYVGFSGVTEGWYKKLRWYHFQSGGGRMGHRVSVQLHWP